MNKKIFLAFLFLIFLGKISLAFCPVCTVAVGAGVGLSQYFGIDDLISGSWLGGFLMALTFWTIDFLNKRKIKFLFRKPLILIFWYSLSILPLYSLRFIGQSENKFWGRDKLLLGIIAGSLVFLFSFFFHNFLIKKNKGKVFFPFQKVIIPVFFLLVLSLIFYFALKYA